MRLLRPQYACVYSATKNLAKTAPEHERGPVLGVAADVVLFGCRRCGVVFWESRPQEAETDLTRCHGVTVRGTRCKLPSQPGSLFCPTHEGQACPAIEGAVWGVPPDKSGKG